ncbi:trypsin-like serine peptidase [Streptomyces scopuliridis]|uniref:Serine protease n=1 Tax=Streptomyces scopuliridis RB72 TaxID=1440053 RepID=A0A2T7SX86_9ACTN|nr:hypothetical protein [Streptomyces scopuliridis]PVE07569.1 hypothetical protein Y717_23460 [Streptomyces scopuliridis RB72]
MSKPASPMSIEELRAQPTAPASRDKPPDLVSPCQSSFYVRTETDKPEVEVSITTLDEHSGPGEVHQVEVRVPNGSRQPFAPVANRLHVVDRDAADHAADGHRPPYLDMVRLPEVREPGRHRPTRLRPIKGRPVAPLNVFQPDRRVEFDSLAYPFCTVGQVAAPVAPGSSQMKVGTGTLIGPRHVLTASHVMNWHWPGPNLSPVSFTPSFNRGLAPFGIGNAIHTYWFRQVDNPDDELSVSLDYIVFVLDQRLGDQLGYMGTMGYSNDWDDKPYWMNVSYPHDLGNDEVPFFQDQVSFEDADNPGIVGQEGDGLYMDTESGSLDHGASGSAFYAFWPNENFSRVVSVASAEGTLNFDDDNWAAGGPPMHRLVNQARTDFP